MAYINFNVLLMLAMVILGIILLQWTRFGRNVYAVGGSEQSAKLMGLPVGRTKVLVYGFNGFCSALAGIAYVLYVKSGWNLALVGGELDVISSAVIGGVLIVIQSVLVLIFARTWAAKADKYARDAGAKADAPKDASSQNIADWEQFSAESS